MICFCSAFVCKGKKLYLMALVITWSSASVSIARSWSLEGCYNTSLTLDYVLFEGKDAPYMSLPHQCLEQVNTHWMFLITCIIVNPWQVLTSVSHSVSGLFRERMSVYHVPGTVLPGRSKMQSLLSSCSQSKGKANMYKLPFKLLHTWEVEVCKKEKFAERRDTDSDLGNCRFWLLSWVFKNESEFSR